LVGHVPSVSEARKIYNILVGKPLEKRPFERPKKNERKTLMDFTETGYDVTWMNPVKDCIQWRITNSVESSGSAP
jgi:hypothetical protein